MIVARHRESIVIRILFSGLTMGWKILAILSLTLVNLIFAFSFASSAEVSTIKKVVNIAVEGAGGARLKRIDTQSWTVEFLVHDYCQEPFTSPCFVPVVETYQLDLNARSSVLIDRIPGHDHAGQVDFAGRQEEILMGIEQAGVDGYIADQQVPVLTRDQESLGTIRVYHRISRVGMPHLSQLVTFEHDSGVEDVLFLQSGFVSQLIVLGKSSETVRSGLEVASCGNTCSVSLHFFEIGYQ